MPSVRKKYADSKDFSGGTVIQENRSVSHFTVYTPLYTALTRVVSKKI
jgi:hypothetical protein